MREQTRVGVKIPSEGLLGERRRGHWRQRHGRRKDSGPATGSGSRPQTGPRHRSCKTEAGRWTVSTAPTCLETWACQHPERMPSKQAQHPGLGPAVTQLLPPLPGPLVFLQAGKWGVEGRRCWVFSTRRALGPRLQGWVRAQWKVGSGAPGRAGSLGSCGRRREDTWHRPVVMQCRMPSTKRREVEASSDGAEHPSG